MDLGPIFYLLPPPPAKLLDFGVGTGWTSVFFAKRGYDVTGQDIAEDMIALADMNKERYGVSNLQFKICDYEKLDLSNEFDCAVFYDCLHHSVDEEKALAAAYRALKPGGICITVEPGEGHGKTEESKRRMQLYGVTERDMPPGKIIKAGQKAGFHTFKIYARTIGPISLKGGWGEKKSGFKRMAWYFVNYFFQFFAKQKNHVVVLVK